MVDAVRSWLSDIGLERYSRVFSNEEIDLGVLPDLTEDDLEKLGIPLGPRKKILRAIAELSAEPRQNLGPENTTTVIETADAEKRQLTVMFCDLVGSTEMSQKLDAEALRDINRMYQEACTHAIKQFDGYVARYMGDGILVYFGYPKAHEDDAERAVRAGLAVVKAVEDIDLEGSVEVELAVRVGIATGPVVVGDLIGEGAAQESAVVGETPNLAARLQATAEPGQVLISQDTQMLVGASVRLEPLGQRILKGFADSIEPWLVVGTGTRGGRFERSVSTGLGRFVGRSAELERLGNDLQVASSGEQIVVHVVGEPGIGKSRLIYEFFKLASQNAQIVEGHCVSHGQATAFLPFVDLLRRTFRLDQEATTDTVVEKLTRELTELDVDRDKHLPFLLNLLGIPTREVTEADPGLVGLKTREALVTAILAQGQGKPLVVFLNDCHWIDQSSEAVLDTLIQDRPKDGLLVLSTFRPEYVPAWGSTCSASRIELDTFSLAEAKLLFSDRFGTIRIDESVLLELFERSGGNPYFAEELARHLHAEDLAEGVREQRLSVPKTLDSLLRQRIDRISSDARRLLQSASVMGRSFDDRLASDVCGLSSPDTAIDELIQSDLILQDRSSQRYSFRFKHALLHDAVYGGLLSKDKSTLHLAVADGLASRYRGREAEIVEELARHYAAAGDSAQASKWAAAAGEKSLHLFAHKEAITWFASVLDLVTRNFDTNPRADLLGSTLVNQMEAHCWEIDYPGMAGLADQHLPRVQAAGDDITISRTFTWLGDAYINTGKFDDALHAAGKAVAIGENLGNLECTGYGLSMHLWLHAVTGDVGDSNYVEERCDRLLDIAEQIQDAYLGTLAYYARSLDLAQRGSFERAKDWIQTSVAFGEESQYSPAKVWALCVRAFINVYDDQIDRAELDAREALRFAQSKYDQLMARMTLSSVLIAGDRPDEGLAMMQEIQRYRDDKKLSQIAFMYWPDTMYGIGLTKVGQVEQGIQYLEDTWRRFTDLRNPRAAARAVLALADALKQRDETDPMIAQALQHAQRLGKDTGMALVEIQALLGRLVLPYDESSRIQDVARAKLLAQSVESSALKNQVELAISRLD